MTRPPAALHYHSAPPRRGPTLTPIRPHAGDAAPIAAYINGDLVEIVRIEPYPEDFLERVERCEASPLGSVLRRGKRIGFFYSEVFYAYLTDGHRWVLSSEMKVKLAAETEGHYPTCGRCGDLWPCGHVEEARHALRESYRVEPAMKWHAEYPVPCGMEHCDERFKTERGRDMHHSRSRLHREVDA